ncbi:MAG: hypothetical protein OER95_09055 [Acidimicrobiia bacterium]|nr:hypothetical protein [Acidimicrobiia bacterium]
MSTAPVVIRPKSVPSLSVACAILLVYFVAKAMIFGGDVGLLSLVFGAVVAIVGLWALWRRRRTVVVIDGDDVTITRGRSSTSFQRFDVASIDLSGLDHHLKMADGTGVRLPLDGRQLVEVGLLLSPPRTRSRGRPAAFGS